MQLCGEYKPVLIKNRKLNLYDRNEIIVSLIWRWNNEGLKGQ